MQQLMCKMGLSCSFCSLIVSFVLFELIQRTLFLRRDSTYLILKEAS